MTKEKDTKDKIKEGITAALPIVIGYFPIAMAFGLYRRILLYLLVIQAYYPC